MTARPSRRNCAASATSYGLGVMAYFALAKGFLSGKYRSKADEAKSAARGGDATDYLTPRGLRILAALDGVAAARSPIARRWHSPGCWPSPA